MKVAHTCFRDLQEKVGGTSVRVIGLANHLSTSTDIHTFTTGPLPSDARPDIENHQLENPDLPLFYKKYFVFLPEYVKKTSGKYVSNQRGIDELIEGDFDIVHCHKHSTALTIELVKDRIEAPVLFEMHGLFESERRLGESSSIRARLLGYLDILFERELVNRSQYIATPSHEMTEYITSNFQIGADQVYTIPAGVDLELFNNDSTVDVENIGVNVDNGPVIMYVGAISELHASIDMLESFKKVSRQNKNAQFIIVTRGANSDIKDAYNTMKQQLENLTELPPRPHQDLPSLLDAADVLVAPYAENKFSDLIPHTKVLEYMASGTPVVVSQTKGHERLITHNKDAYLYEPGDPDSLARGILKILDDECLYDRLSKNSREVAEMHSLEKSASKAVQVYESMNESEEA